ncbi:MAG: folylpolyglutamate synthase/dihydrofolate synthase family protein [Pseudomonadota bacterium]
MIQIRSEAVSPELAEWLGRINTLDPSRIELGLARVNAVLPRLGIDRDILTISVAGTNGKGTSVHLVDSLLRAVGNRVGRYTSPHLSRFNERIAIDNEPVSDAELIAAFEAVATAQLDTPLTYFEFTTLAALVVFSRASVAVQVLEVGLGGRLDAVNAVIPDACLLTGVDFDHQKWLGDTLDAIGREKAGIFRASVPAVVATPNPPKSVLETARAVAADLWRAGDDFAVDEGRYRGRDRTLDLPELNDPVQLQLLAGVLAVLESLGLLVRIRTRDIEDALGTPIPARLELITREHELLLDVAHNPQSIDRLAAWLQANPARRGNTLVMGAMRDKPVAQLVERLTQVIDRWIAVAADLERAMEAAELAAIMAQAAGAPALVAGSPIAGLRSAESLTPQGGRIVVAGSFPVVGAIRAAL